MGISIHKLVLEATRRCNMACANCLRGDAENRDFDCSLFSNVFSGLESIDVLEITGGEPSLYGEFFTALKEYLKTCPADVRSCRIETNGKAISKPMIGFADWVHQNKFAGMDAPQLIVRRSSVWHEPLPKSTLKKWGELEKKHPFIHSDDGLAADVNQIKIGRASGMESAIPFQDVLDYYGERSRMKMAANNIRFDGQIVVNANRGVSFLPDYAYNDEDRLFYGDIREEPLVYMLVSQGYLAHVGSLANMPES